MNEDGPERGYSRISKSIAINQSNLATVLRDLGEREEARDLLKKAYATALARLGFDHPTTRTIRANLGNLEGK
jgi:hypothetical protein